MMERFYKELNFYWQFFDVDADGCITVQEVQDQIHKAYDVTDEEIIQYWITYYYTTYGITEHYFWIYYLGNGDFDWEGYNNHIDDGPAFDGAEWLVLHGN